MIADNFQLGCIKSARFRWRGAEGGTCFKNCQNFTKDDWEPSTAVEP